MEATIGTFDIILLGIIKIVGVVGIGCFLIIFFGWLANLFLAGIHNMRKERSVDNFINKVREELATLIFAATNQGHRHYGVESRSIEPDITKAVTNTEGEVVHVHEDPRKIKKVFGMEEFPDNVISTLKKPVDNCTCRGVYMDPPRCTCEEDKPKPPAVVINSDKPEPTTEELPEELSVIPDVVDVIPEETDAIPETGPSSLPEEHPDVEELSPNLTQPVTRDEFEELKNMIKSLQQQPAVQPAPAPQAQQTQPTFQEQQARKSSIVGRGEFAV